MNALLKSLSEAAGVSGAEGEVRKLILEAIKDHVSDVTIDPMGNLMAVRKGAGSSPLRVMVSAHMDEIGFMVAEIGEDGLIHVVTVGKHDDRLAPSQRVLVGNGKTPGVFIWKPIHMSHGENKLIAAKDMAIDVGADDKSGVKAGPGERVAFAGNFTELSSAVVRGKAFDSRAACAALIDLLDDDPFPFDLHVVFTAQAAIGGRGAGVAAHRIAPHAAFVLTGMACNDLPADPDGDDHAPVIRLGGGPVISALDAVQVADRRLIAHVQNVAKTKAIPYQIEALNGARSELSVIGASRAGVSAVTMGVPVRYMGSPNALLNLDDLNQLGTLLRESLAALTPDLLEA